MAIDSLAKRLAVLVFGSGWPSIPSGTVDVNARAASLGSYGALLGGPPPPLDPHLVLTPTSLLFFTTAGGSSPATQDVIVSNSGGGSISPSTGTIVTDNGGSWLTANFAGDTLTVTATLGVLPAGTYTGTIPIISSGADNTPINLPVTFIVNGTGGSGTVLLGFAGRMTRITQIV